ncbi:MAG TPA: S46 family peptidase [Thermoanaerobaculia bacterium]
MLKKFVVAVLLLVTASFASADEGMWMPQQVPQLADQLKAKGLQLDPGQFADLTGFPMGAIVSLGGCSASFISPAGLIATNHHCVYGYLQFNSTKEKDYLTNGFLAPTRAAEIQASPNARVYVTTGIEDVTGRILGKISPKTSDVDRAKLIEQRRKEIVGECEKAGGVRCRVASFFAGTQYLKTTQMEIRDVRLVYAPAEGVGNFGGETDNWMWPRHTGDFGLLRAYVGPDGKPADFSPANVPYQPKHFLKVSTADIDPGDLMIVAGYPGVTFRYETAQETAMKIDYDFPTSIHYRQALMDILERESKRGRDVEILNAGRIKGLANYLKKYQGTLDAFKKGNLQEVRAAEERKMRALFANDEALLKKHQALMDELTRIFAEEQKTQQRDTVVGWLYQASPMLAQASTLHELSRQRAKKDMDREEGMQERDWPQIKGRITSAQRSIDVQTDRAGLAYFLKEAASLPADQRIEAVDKALAATGKEGVDAQIEAFLDQLYGNTKIADLAYRQDLFDDSTAELLARKDAMIDFAASLRPLLDANREAGRKRSGALARLRPQYMEALRAVRGGLLAPDANGTLRVTFGEVGGYEPRDGVTYEPFTTVEGILEKDTGSGEFDSPDKLLEMARAKKFGPYADPELGTLPVDFLTDVDITNGNSGSATMNAMGEFTGLAFDGNYEAMGVDYVVDPALSRTIHVDSRYMVWVMDAVDGADAILEEMGIEPAIQ